MHGLRPELAFEPASGSRSLPPTRWRSTVAERPPAKQGFHLICDEPKVPGRWVVYPGAGPVSPGRSYPGNPLHGGGAHGFSMGVWVTRSPFGSRELQAQSRIPGEDSARQLPSALLTLAPPDPFAPDTPSAHPSLSAGLHQLPVVLWRFPCTPLPLPIQACSTLGPG